jgi:outer membrane protein
MSEADVAHAQSLVEVSLSTLAAATGQHYEQLKRLPADIHLPAPDPDDIGAWVVRATDQNLAVMSGQIATKLAKFDYDKARASRLPVIDIVGTYAYEHPTGGYPGPHESIDQQIGLRIKQPIYTGGAIDSTIRAAQAKWDEAQAQEDQAKADAVRQARTAFFQARSGLQQIPALQQAIDAAVTGEDAAEVGYRVGTRTAAQMLDAIRQRYQAEAAYSTARYQYLTSTLQLKLAVGSLTTDDLQAINGWLR